MKCQEVLCIAGIRLIQPTGQLNVDNKAVQVFADQMDNGKL